MPPTAAPPLHTADGKLDLSGAADPVTGQPGPSEVAFRMRWPAHGYPGEFILRRSMQSGLLYNSPRLDDARLEALYGANYYFFHRHPRREFRRNAQLYSNTVRLVEDRVQPRRVLDVGCARGYMPAILKGLGWEAHGVEISPSAADHARRHFGLDVFTGVAEEYAQKASAGEVAPFPLVTALDVLEHVPDPAAFAEALSRLTPPGGRLIVATPNADAANIDIRGTRWHGFNPYHIYLFNADNLGRLLGRFGFDVERAFTCKNTPVNAPGGEPTARKLRNGVARALEATGLLRPAFRTFYGLKKRLVSEVAPEPFLAPAVEAARAAPPFDETPDAKAPLAEGCRGDDLVVIAQRR